MKLYFELVGCAFLHATIVRLTNNCDDKVHKNYITNYYYHQIYNPNENFVITLACNTISGIKITYRFSHCNNKVSDRSKSIIISQIILEKNGKNYCEETNYDSKE